MKNSVVLGLFYLLASCVTMNGDKSTFRFPEKFNATQKMQIQSKDKKNSFVVQLEKNHTTYKILLLDPILMAPLIKIYHNNGKVEWQNFVTFPMQDQQIEQLAKLIAHIYDGSGYELGVTYQWGQIAFIFVHLPNQIKIWHVENLFAVDVENINFVQKP